jgi:hypothetical protein
MTAAASDLQAIRIDLNNLKDTSGKFMVQATHEADQWRYGDGNSAASSRHPWIRDRPELLTGCRLPDEGLDPVLCLGTILGSRTFPIINNTGSVLWTTKVHASSRLRSKDRSLPHIPKTGGSMDDE